MNILELKLALDDALKEINESKYDIRQKEAAGIINNEINDQEPTPEIHQKADLIFHSIGAGRLPSGGSYVTIECTKEPETNTPWEEMLKSIDNVMDSVSLNAPVIFTYEQKPIFLWSIFSSGGYGEGPDGAKVYYARLLIQFLDHENPLYGKALEDMRIKLGLPRSPQGRKDPGRGRLS